MRPTCLIVLLAALAPAPVTAQANDDDTPVVRVGGEVVTRAAYEDWLFTRLGAENAFEFALETAAVRAAEKRGLLPGPERIAAEYEAERLRNVDQYFKGDQALWELDLQRRGYDPAGHARRRQHALRAEMCLAAIAREDRVISEEDIEKRYRVLYGQDEEHTSIEILFFNMYAGVDPAVQPRPTPAELKAGCLRRAQTVHAAWVSGSSREQLIDLTDPIKSEFVERGSVRHYRRSMLGPELDKALDMLDRPGEISAPVEVWDGHFIVRLVERKAVTLESARDKILAELEAQPAHSSEVGLVRQQLLTEFGVEVLMK